MKTIIVVVLLLLLMIGILSVIIPSLQQQQVFAQTGALEQMMSPDEIYSFPIIK